MRTLLLLSLAFSCSTNPDPAREARDTARRLSLEERAGQLVFGFARSGDAKPGTDARARIEQAVAQHSIGGAVISIGSVRDAARLTRALDAKAAHPMLFAADFEAGVGYRLEGGTRFPSALAFGATGLPRLAEHAARATAFEGKELGVHWALHPVADLNTNPDNPIINTRSFGERPNDVAKFVAATVRGFERAGMLACLKHFPGHGDVSQDSHQTLPTVPGDRQRFFRVESVPFRAGIEAGAASVMTGHLSLPAFIDPSTPATMSKDVLQGLLRDKLGFDGCVITDALDMGAITERRRPGEAAVEALRAGADVILMPPDVGAACREIAAAVRDGRLSRDRFDAAVRRVLELKARAGLLAERTSERPAPRWSVVGASHHHELAERIARRAITLVRDRKHLLPLRIDDRTLVLSIVDTPEPDPQSRTRGLGEALGCEHLALSPASDAGAVRSALDKAKAASTLIVALWIRVNEFSGSIGLPKNLAGMAPALAGHPRATVVSLGNPYLLRSFANTGTYVAAYDECDAVVKAVARALTGKATIDGRLPVRIPEHAACGTGMTLGAASERLETGKPEDEGLPKDLARRVRRFAESAIERRVAPGCQIAIVRRNRLVLDEGYGRETYDASAARITRTTRYDLASLTKIVATTAVAMALHGRGELDLEHRVKDLVRGFGGGDRDAITLRQVLAHSSGLLGWKPLYKGASTPKDVLDNILATPLKFEPGRSMEYSDLGFILLGKCLEKLGGARLDVLAKRLVYDPLGMTRTQFGPIAEGVAVAPTEVVASRGGLIRGTVHDENAAALDGIAGHAGLFSTARDVAVYMRSVLAGGALGGKRVFSRKTIEEFTRRANLVLDSSRALGFDTPYPNSSAGRHMSPRSIGHTGFTGTCVWADPERDLIIVTLTNRVHPTRRNKSVHSFRRGLHDLVIESLTVDPYQKPK